MIWSIFSRSPWRSDAGGAAARSGDPKRAARSAAVPVAVTDLRNRRRLCLRILMVSPGVTVDSPNPLSTACRELHFPRYHDLMTVVRSGNDASNDWIERELESGRVIRVP